jgi:YgiT-type zinc finger domain-containing protein
MTAEGTKRLTRCPNCGHARLRETTIADRFEYGGYDGTALVVEVPDVPVEVCDQCGEQYLGPAAARAQNNAVCRALGLLTADEIPQVRRPLAPRAPHSRGG